MYAVVACPVRWPVDYLIRGRYAYRILILFLAIVISFLAFNYEVNGKPYEFVADFDRWTQTVVKNKS